jgi:hypothetical protein
MQVCNFTEILSIIRITLITMSYTNSKHKPLDKDVEILIDKIRTGDPAKIAPEVYGLRKRLADEPAVTVLKLMELENEVLATYDTEIDGKKIDMRPNTTESFKQWKKRTGWSEDMDGGETAAYTNIGYDWVDWKWLEPGQSPLTGTKPGEKPRYEVLKKTVIRPKSKAEFEETYRKCLKISAGNSGSADESKNTYEIRTFAPSAEKLQKAGYKDLKFCNGGDDDVLIVDHKNKEYAFFEDNVPEKLVKNPMYKLGNLRELWYGQDLER